MKKLILVFGGMLSVSIGVAMPGKGGKEEVKPCLVSSVPVASTTTKRLTISKPEASTNVLGALLVDKVRAARNAAMRSAGDTVSAKVLFAAERAELERKQ